MHLISISRLRVFISQYPDVENQIEDWDIIVRSADWQNLISEYQRVLAIIESLMHQNISTEEERMLNLFLILIEKFEADNYPIPCTSTPQRRFQHLIEANNLPATELVGIFGSVATLTDVLDGKKMISSNQAQQLADRFHLPATIFLV